MNSAILTILFVLCIMLIPGFYGYSLVKRSQSRIYLFVAGLFLIIWSSVTLYFIALSTGIADAIITEASVFVAFKKEIEDFKPFILIFGSVYTLLFGGVGTNIIASALVGDRSIDQILKLNKLESLIRQNNKEIISIKYVHLSYLILNLIIAIIIIM